MLKKLLLLILCLVLLPPACPASASTDDEVETVQSFGEISSLFFIYGFILGESHIEFHTSPQFSAKAGEDFLRKGIWEIVSRWCMEGSTMSIRDWKDGGKTVNIWGIKLRPGIRMAEAATNGITDRLTKTEKDCMQQISKVVKNLQKKYPPNSVELELAIFDYICDRLEYKTGKSDAEREKLTSACYAFLNGKGNCQAYADLFYTMTTMAGFESFVISGEAGKNSGGHVWNGILIGSELVMVDVTFGDNGDDYYSRPCHYYFNFGLDRVGNHRWYKEVFDYPFMQKTKDSLTFYSGKNNTLFGGAVKTRDEAWEYCVRRAKSGYSDCEVLIKNKSYSTKDLNPYFSDIAGRNRSYGECSWNICTLKYDGNTVLEIHWTAFDNKKLK